MKHNHRPCRKETLFKRFCLDIARGSSRNGFSSNYKVLFLLPLGYVIGNLLLWHWGFSGSGLVLCADTATGLVRLDIDVALIWYGFVIVSSMGFVLFTAAVVMMIRGFKYIGAASTELDTPTNA
jgi:hypothetical protein